MEMLVHMMKACNFNGLGLFLNLDKEVNDHVRHLYTNVLPPEVSQELLEGQHSIDKLLLSWPVGHLPSCPPKVVHGKIAIAELIAGVGNYEDTFSHPPVLSPQTLAECYAKEKYSGDDSDDALGVLDDRATQMEVSRDAIVVRGFDTNEWALSASEDSSTLVEFMKNRTPYGEDGPRWQLIDTYLRVDVMMLMTPDGHVRILFLFGPFCFAIFYKHGQKSEGDVGDVMCHEGHDHVRSVRTCQRPRPIHPFL